MHDACCSSGWGPPRRGAPPGLVPCYEEEVRRRGAIHLGGGLAVGGSAALFAACSSFGSADVGAVDAATPVGGDGSVADAPSSLDVVSDGAPSDAGSDGGNYFANGGFEEPGPGCGGTWGLVGFNSTLEQSNEHNTGAHSCKVCSKTLGATGFTLDPGDIITSAQNGETYELSVFMKIYSLKGGPLNGDVVIRVAQPSDGGKALDISPAGATVIDDTWRLHQLKYTLRATGPVNAYVSFGGGEGCVLIDDLSLRRVP